MRKVGDTLSLVILGLCCGGTFVGLSLTSIAKKAKMTGAPDKPDMPWLRATEEAFEARLRALDNGQSLDAIRRVQEANGQSLDDIRRAQRTVAAAEKKE